MQHFDIFHASQRDLHFWFAFGEEGHDRLLLQEGSESGTQCELVAVDAFHYQLNHEVSSQCRRPRLREVGYDVSRTRYYCNGILSEILKRIIISPLT